MRRCTVLSNISKELKAKCVTARIDGYSVKQIYQDIFCPEHAGMSFHTFRNMLPNWVKSMNADITTLLAGTYPQFSAHGATVQVNNSGKVVQAWIKQSANKIDTKAVLECISNTVVPVNVEACKNEPEDKAMLEIPLFDMHFGIASIDTYKEQLSEILDILDSKKWSEVNIVLGQDALHSNDMRNHTAKGTLLDPTDFTRAWKDAYTFYSAIITKSILCAPKVNVIYSIGNHDECTAWCLFKTLEQIFPQATFDDSLDVRKLIHWENCFIGITHGCYKRSKPTDLRNQFTIEFPIEYAHSTVREIHCGHLHREQVDDISGVVTRRCSTRCPETPWEISQGYTGSSKRFLLFGYTPGRLRNIYVI